MSSLKLVSGLSASSFGVQIDAAELYSRRVSLSTTPKMIMLSAPARKIDQKFIALADLGKNSRFGAEATNHVDTVGCLKSGAVSSVE
jgi:hypothetical protein